MYERLGLPSLLQSLHKTTATATTTTDAATTIHQDEPSTNHRVDHDHDGGSSINSDVLDAGSVDAQLIDALFARITAAATAATAASKKKTSKKTSKNGKSERDNLVQEKEDEGGMLLVGLPVVEDINIDIVVSEEQQRVALALAELEISLQGVSVSICLSAYVCYFYLFTNG